MIRGLMLFLLVAGALAFAGSTSSKFVLPAVNGAPTDTSHCIALSVGGVPVTSVDVTVIDHNDGGATDDDAILFGKVLAWRWDTNTTLPDGGGGLARESSYDVNFMEPPANEPRQRARTFHVALPALGIDLANTSAKFCVSTLGVATDGGSVVDAGALLVHDVLLTAHY